MELDNLIDEFYGGLTQKFEGIISIKDIDTNVSSNLQRDQNGALLMVNILAINRTNIGMSCTYVVDIKEDDKDKVVSDFESLVAYMFFGVDKVAKASVPIKT